MRTALKRHYFSVHALTIKGLSYDPTVKVSNDVSFIQWMHEVEIQLAQIRLAHDTIVLGGISTGANLALAIGLKSPALVDGLVLISLPLFLDGWKIP